MTEDAARAMAQAWVEAWNSHDLDAIMHHYADAIEFTSPFVTALLDEPSGTLTGRAALRSYFEQGLARYPDLVFDLHEVLPGVRSLVVVYESVNNLLAAETMEVDDAGLVRRVLAHYTPMEGTTA